MVADQSAPAPARERVLEAAQRVVIDVGAARLTLDAVAQTAGVSKGGLLYHFPSKESLLLALGQRYCESLLLALGQRYCESLHCCVEVARDSVPEGPGRELRAFVVGILGDRQRVKAMGAVLLATAATDMKLLEVIRERIAEHMRQLAASSGDFARAAIVTLAVDGLMMRESLRISACTPEQREAIVNELLQLADEAYR